MVLLTFYRRVALGVFGGILGLGLIAFPLTRHFLRYIAYSLEICYNYTVYLLGTQEKYTSYLNTLTLDISFLKDRAELLPYFYTALIVLSLISALFFALAFYKRVPVILSFIVPAAALIPFFYYGIVPHFAAFSLFLSAGIGCYGQSVVQHIIAGRNRREKRLENGVAPRKKKQTGEERLAFAGTYGSFGMVTMALMLLLTVSIAAVIYTRPLLQLDAVREGIDKISTHTMNTLFRSSYEKKLQIAGYMAPDETALSLMPPNWRDLPVAEVASNSSRPVYLRYRTTVDLEDDGWSVPDEAFEEDYSNSVGTVFCEYTQYYEFLKLTAPDGDPLTAGLDDVHSEDQGYWNDIITVYPQYTESNLLGLPPGAASGTPVSEYSDLERKNDTVVWYNDTPKDRSYMFHTVTPALTDEAYLLQFDALLDSYKKMRREYEKEGLYLNREREYKRFVMRHYLDVPEELGKSVQDLTNEITAPYSTAFQKTQAVERYLRANYTYSTTRQRLEAVDENGDHYSAAAEDYVRYFLLYNEKKEGYCTLFASAMTAMLRQIQIPARVVTGYYTEMQKSSQGGYEGNIRDYGYHAWVEVYFDGAGWIPFDPTPGFGVNPNYLLLNLVDQGRGYEIVSEVEIEFENDSDFVYYNRTLPDPTGAEDENPPTWQIESVIRAMKAKKTILTVVLWTAGVLFALALILLFSRLWHRRCIKKTLKLPPGEGALHAYRMIMRLMQMRGFRFFEGELWEDFARRADNLKITPEPLLPMARLLQKALYANQDITEEDRVRIAEFLCKFDRELFRRTNIFKAVWYRYTFHWKPRRKRLIWNFK